MNIKQFIYRYVLDPTKSRDRMIKAGLLETEFSQEDIERNREMRRVGVPSNKVLDQLAKEILGEDTINATRLRTAPPYGGPNA